MAATASQSASDSATITFHGFPLSGAQRRALLVAEEKGVPYSLEFVDMSTREHKKPEFMEFQPFGKVPHMTDGPELDIYESRAMMQYLAEKYADQGPRLLGSSLQEKARVLQWLNVENNEWNAPAMAILGAWLKKGSFLTKESDEEAIKAPLAQFEAVLDVLERQLEKTPYLAGDSISIADLAFMPVLSYLLDAGIRAPFKARARLWSWWERLSERDSWKKIAVGTWVPPAPEGADWA